MSLTRSVWMTFGGTPVTGVVPTTLRVHPIGAQLTPEQLGGSHNAYQQFANAVRLSAFPNGYHKHQRQLQDGTIVTMESINGVHRVSAITSGGGRTSERKSSERFIFRARKGSGPSEQYRNRFYNNPWDVTYGLEGSYGSMDAQFLLFSTDAEFTDVRLEIGWHRSVLDFAIEDPALGGSGPPDFNTPNASVPVNGFRASGLTKLRGQFYGRKAISKEFFTNRVSFGANIRFYFGGGGGTVFGDEGAGTVFYSDRAATSIHQIVRVPAGSKSPLSEAVPLAPPNPSKNVTVSWSGENATVPGNPLIKESYRGFLAVNGYYSFTPQGQPDYIFDPGQVGYNSAIDIQTNQVTGVGIGISDEFFADKFYPDHQLGDPPPGDLTAVGQVVGDAGGLGSVRTFSSIAKDGKSVVLGTEQPSRYPPVLDPFRLKWLPLPGSAYQKGAGCPAYRTAHGEINISPGTEWGVYIPYGLTEAFTLPQSSLCFVPNVGDYVFAPGSATSHFMQPMQCITPTRSLWLWNPPHGQGYYRSSDTSPLGASSFVGGPACVFMMSLHGQTSPYVIRPGAAMLKELAGVIGVDPSEASDYLLSFHEVDLDTIQPNAEYRPA